MRMAGQQQRGLELVRPESEPAHILLKEFPGSV